MRILILSFYFQPDLCAGSFRCTALVKQLSKIPSVSLDVVTTLPNRYSSFSAGAKEYEACEGFRVHRVPLPSHNSGLLDQIKAFTVFYFRAMRITRASQYDAVFATSSRLFTALLGARIASKKKLPLYLDIRDIFVDTINDVLPRYVVTVVKPVLSLVEKYTFSKAKRINLVSRGFEGYFKSRYSAQEYRWYTNGIDKDFLNFPIGISNESKDKRLTIVYAGNIGEGQGLHQIVPMLSRQLGEDVEFNVIGDGGRKQQLVDALALNESGQAVLHAPVQREELVEWYSKADVLFLHLNDYEAFEKVLPSKIFEYAATGKPILAGVSGYAAQFLRAEVSNSQVFRPGDAVGAATAFRQLKLGVTPRASFVEKYTREKIMTDMASDIASFVGDSS